MIREQLTAALLGHTTIKVLEETAFVFTEAAPAPRPFGGKVLQARLALSDSTRAEVVLAVEPALAVTLAANLLGDEPDAPEAAARGRDALGELLNILGGALLEQAARGGRLGLPAVSECAAADHEAQRARAQRAVSLVTEDGARVDALVFLEPAG